VERASRLIVLISIAAAGVVNAWLAHSAAAFAPTAAGAFIITLALARFSLGAAVAVVACTAYVAPALLTSAFRINDYSLLVIWLAAAAGPVFAQATTPTWHFATAWKLPLVAWLLVLAISWPVVVAREIDFSLIVARSDGVANGIVQTSPPINGAFVSIVALTQMLALVWLDLLCARFRQLDAATLARRLALPFIAGIVLSSLVGGYQRFVDLDFLNLSIWANLGRAGGLMNDANSLGIGAALWAPVAIAVGWSMSRPLLGIPLYVVLAMGTWSTGSRTALMALVAGSAAVLIGLLQRRGVWQPGYGRRAAVVAAVLLIAAAAVLPREFESGSGLRRALDRMPRLEAGEIRRFVVEDLWVRFGYGQAAVDIVRDYPVAGVGIGAFHNVAPEFVFRRTGRAVPADNAQNWWRHQIAELGLLGSVPALWSSMLVLGLLFVRVEPTSPHASVITVLRGSVIGLTLASLFGVPTQHPATALSFVTVLFWLQRLTSTEDERTPEWSRHSWMAAFVLSLVVAVSLGISARGGLHPRERAEATGAPYAHGLSASEGMSAYGDFRWAARHAVLITPSPRPWLQLTLWAPYGNVVERRVETRVRLNGREVVAHTFASADAETYFLAVPPSSRSVTVEIVTTGTVSEQRAVQTAILWRDGIPRNAPDNRIVR
jgi:hypothetical protein